MKSTLLKIISATLCICLLLVGIPMANAQSVTLYDGKWNDGNWTITGNGAVDETGEVLSVTNGANCVATLADTYSLGKAFNFSIDYAIVNNYNCNESQYSSLSIGDLTLYISDKFNPDAPSDSDEVTNKRPYLTCARLQWQGKELAADYCYDSMYVSTYVTYGVDFDNGDIVVTRKTTGETRAILRVSAKTFKAAAGTNYSFANSAVVIKGNEKYKTTRFKNFVLNSGSTGEEYINISRVETCNNHGDINGSGTLSAVDFLDAQLIALGHEVGGTCDMTQADADKSGAFDSADVLFIQQMMLGVKEYAGAVTTKYLALTFDDGPSYSTTTRILDIFERNNAKATFFVVAKNIANAQYNLERADELGFEIGSHSWSHQNFKTLLDNGDDETIMAEINDANAAITAVTGKEVTLFRFPLVHAGYPFKDFAKYNFGMTYICGYFVGINDTDTVASRTQKIKELAVDGNIILMHDSGYNYRTVEALEEAVPWLIQNGFELVTVSELAQIKGVTMDKGETLYSKF